MKFLIISILTLLYFESIPSQAENTNWPQDHTTPFSYPTPGPINIITSQTRTLETPTPLKFSSDVFQSSIARNTGSSLIIYSTTNEKAIISGGVLYNDTYEFFRTEYFWDLDLQPNVATKINGFGAQIEVVVSYFNRKYGNLQNAVIKRDGIAQIVLFAYVTLTPNKSYYPFLFMLQPIKRAGTSTTISEKLSNIWYFQPTKVDHYYAYPGQFSDRKTGQIYYSSTVIVLVRKPQPSISFTQFYASLGSLRNRAGAHYSHKLSIAPRGKRPVVHCKGLIQG